MTSFDKIIISLHLDLKILINRCVIFLVLNVKLCPIITLYFPQVLFWDVGGLWRYDQTNGVWLVESI